MSAEEEKKRLHLERRRNILMLMAQYLDDFGLNQTKAMLIDESKLPVDRYHVCDNVDLDSIYLDYCSYYQLKFGKAPKICRRLEKVDDVAPPDRRRTNAATAATQSKKKQQQRGAGALKRDQSDGDGGNNCLDEFNTDGGLTIVPLFGPTCGQDQIAEMTAENGSDGSCNGAIGGHLTQFDYINDFMEFPKEWRDLAHAVARDILKSDADVKWSDIQGCESAKSILRESVILPLDYPHLFVGAAKPWKGILLHGPPGTGKTLIAKALYTETKGKVTFFNVASSTLTSKWRGDSEKFVRVLFAVAKLYAPSLIFFDEIESLTSRRDHHAEHEASRRFKNEFLSLIDGLDGEGNRRADIVLLANTNLPWEIDPAFLRRFERKIFMGLPTAEHRVNIIRQMMPIANNWDEIVRNDISIITNGFTGDDIRIACKEASIQQIRKLVADSGNFKTLKNDNHLADATPHDLLQAIQQISPVSAKLSEKHEEWSNHYGNKL